MNKLIPLWMTTLLLFGSPVLVQNSYSTGSLAQRCEGCGLPTLLQSQVAGPGCLISGFIKARMTSGLSGVSRTHALQRHIPPEKLVRVCACDAVASFLVILFGERVAGPLACRYGMSHVLIFSALAMVIVTIAISLIPAIRGFGEG